MRLKRTMAFALAITMVLGQMAFAWEVQPYTPEEHESMKQNIGKPGYDNEGYPLPEGMEDVNYNDLVEKANKSVMNTNSGKGRQWNEQQIEKGLKEEKSNIQIKQAVKNKMEQTNVDSETQDKVEEIMEILSKPEYKDYLDKLVDEKDSTLKEILRLENEGNIEAAVALATEQVDKIYEEIKELEEVKQEEITEEVTDLNKEENKAMTKHWNSELQRLRKLDGVEKETIKQIQDEIKKLRKGEYTEEELNIVKAEAEALKAQYSDLRTLPVENINVVGKNVKFDTPPVIKGGRTLVPVRAITEGLGAEVKWNDETKEVTITKDGTVIVLTLGSNEVTVNGEVVQIDTEANMYSNRTYVPIRFISETFKANVNWDNDNEVIEIDPVEDEEDLEEEIEEVEEETIEEVTEEPVEETTEETELEQ